jgi:protein-S-isoprenylcysteine O-methyltransferase Ste14
MKRLTRWTLVVILVSGLIFGLAGTWSDPFLWAYAAVFAAAGFFAMWSIDDDLARERFSPPSAGADRLSLRLIRLIALAHIIVGALDVGRFHWTSMPDSLRVVGIAGFGLSFVLMVRAMTANRFFSAVVRVQTDRGHHVVDTGPYRVVRHPGYAAMIPLVPFSGLALGSWLAVAIGLVYSAMIVRRALFEDRFLHANLNGYAEYAGRVRYRLVPGAW